jgi:hypothetical protein
MKKRILLLLLLFVLTPIIYFCFIKYAFWQTISISGVGTFKVPQKWTVTQRGDFIYITNKPIDEEGYIIYLAGSTRNDMRRYYDFSDYEFGKNIIHIENVRSPIFSNSARYYIDKYKINGNIEEKYVLEFWGSSQKIRFLVWDNLINEDTIIKIGKSYAMYL